MSAALVRLSTRLNPLASAILRSPIHWLLSPGLMLITVTGRRSGQRYTIPVGYHEMSDAIVILISEAPSKQWWRNYRQVGPIELRVRGQVRHGRALVLPPESGEFRARAEASFNRSRVIPRIFGVDYNPNTGLCDADVRRLRERAAIVRVTLET